MAHPTINPTDSMNAPLVFPLCILLVLMGILTGCYYDNEEELYPSGGDTCDISGVTYSATIVPILQTNCYVCHEQAANQGNVTLEGYSNAAALANSGRLYGAVSHSAGFSPLPKGGNKLLDCDIRKIKAWVDAGAPEN